MTINLGIKRGFEVAKGFEDQNINLPKRGTKHAAGYDFEASKDTIIPSIWDLKKLIDTQTAPLLSKALFGFELSESEMKNPKIMEEKLELLEEGEQMEIAIKVLTLFDKLTKNFPDLIIDGGFSPNIAAEMEIQEFIEMGLISQDVADELTEIQKLMKPVLVPTGVKAYMGDQEFLQLANRSSNPLKSKLVLANGIGIIDSDYYENEDNDGHIMFQFINFGDEAIRIKKGDRIGQGVFLPFLIADNDIAGGERTGGHGSTGN